jgi:hypothetical protein
LVLPADDSPAGRDIHGEVGEKTLPCGGSLSSTVQSGGRNQLLQKVLQNFFFVHGHIS